MILLEVLWSFALAEFVTNILKIYVGRPRPNFFALCEWRDGKCHANEHDARNAYKSFPSGHSSSAFSTFGLFSIHFVSTVVRLLQNTGRTTADLRGLDPSSKAWCQDIFVKAAKCLGRSSIMLALLP